MYMRYKNIIFDFDGVLHDTFDFHLKKINKFFDTKITAEDFRTMHDGNFYTSQAKKRDWSAYAKNVATKEGALVMDSVIKNALTTLSKEHNLYVISSGFAVQIKPYLVNNNVRHLFSNMLFAEDSPSKEEKLRMIINQDTNEYVFVTDTLGDILEAKKVGVSTIAVTFGFHSYARLQKGEPDLIVNSWKELVGKLSSTNK